MLSIYKHIFEARGKAMLTDIVFIYLAKAFDKVSHFKLLNKIKLNGISENVFDFLKSSLSDRKQRVKTGINNIYSDYSDVISGVPHGSIIGPLLL